MKKCPKCGEIYDDTWKVCLHCGSVKLEDFGGPIPEIKQSSDEWFNKENWEEILQEKLASDMGVSKTELIEALKKKPYPKWVRLYSIGVGAMVVIALLFAIPYFVSAVYFERFKKAMHKGEFEKAFISLNKSIKATPNAKQPWMYAVILEYGFGEEATAEETLKNLPFTDKEKQDLREGGKSFRKKMNEKMGET